MQSEATAPGGDRGRQAMGKAPELLPYLDLLEAESVAILREVAAACRRPVMLYSVGKDSSVLLRLAQKAFYPEPIPFPLLHVDTGFKFQEMLQFRDRAALEAGAELLVWRNEEAIRAGTNPLGMGTQSCCGLLKTRALLDALEAHGVDGAIGGARRDEERSRAKERVFSFRDAQGRWDAHRQRPEVWNLYPVHLGPGESVRVFPLSNWTELDIWRYIVREQIPVVDLYFARERPMLVRGETLLPAELDWLRLPGEQPQQVRSRLRSLGCSPCTGAIRSDADTPERIVKELARARTSERSHRAIDHDTDGSMELKKREGYF